MRGWFGAAAACFEAPGALRLRVKSGSEGRVCESLYAAWVVRVAATRDAWVFARGELVIY